MTFRFTALTLTVLLFAGAPIRASPVVVNDVIQVLSSQHSQVDLRLRSIELSSPNGIYHLALQSSQGKQSQGVGEHSTLLASGIDQKPELITVDQGEVEGTVCDCGEIPIAGGGFPKWPWLLLAGIPLFFVHGGSDSSPIPPSSSPSSPPLTINPQLSPSPVPVPFSVTETPEPASLFLFGTSLTLLGASLRRRKKRETKR